MAAPARREQVLDAALGIIARDGYAAVSIDAIARELDVTRPVIYSQFDGLDALLQALLDRQSEATPEAVRRRIGRDREAVRARIEALSQVAADAGGLPVGVDPRILSHTLVAIGEHFGRLLIEDATAVDPAAVATTLSALIAPPRRRRPV